MGYACQWCGRPCGTDYGCLDCGAMFYCTPAHKRKHHKVAHHAECSRMRQQMQQYQELSSTGLQVWNPAANPVATPPTCSMLQTWGCHLQPLWRWQCECSQGTAASDWVLGDWWYRDRHCVCSNAPAGCNTISAAVEETASTGAAAYCQRVAGQEAQKSNATAAAAAAAATATTVAAFGQVHTVGLDQNNVAAAPAAGAAATATAQHEASGLAEQRRMDIGNTGPSIATWMAEPLAAEDVPRATATTSSHAAGQPVLSQPGGRGHLGLPPGAAPCLASRVAVFPQPLQSWTQYYWARGLPLDSPAGILMHGVLTLHWALHLVDRLYPEWGMLAPGSIVHIHLLGARNEVDEMDAFRELGCLLPELHLHLHLIGPDVPRRMDAAQFHWPSPTATSCSVPDCSCGIARHAQDTLLNTQTADGAPDIVAGGNEAGNALLVADRDKSGIATRNERGQNECGSVVHDDSGGHTEATHYGQSQHGNSLAVLKEHHQEVHHGLAVSDASNFSEYGLGVYNEFSRDKQQSVLQGLKQRHRPPMTYETRDMLTSEDTGQLASSGQARGCAKHQVNDHAVDHVNGQARYTCTRAANYAVQPIDNTDQAVANPGSIDCDHANHHKIKTGEGADYPSSEHLPGNEPGEVDRSCVGGKVYGATGLAAACTPECQGCCTVHLHHGMYHQLAERLGEPPHLVFAPNAGLAAYPSWIPTIELLAGMLDTTCDSTTSDVFLDDRPQHPCTHPQQRHSRLRQHPCEVPAAAQQSGLENDVKKRRHRVPFVFTDYLEEAQVQALAMLQHCVPNMSPSTVMVNPFRKPLPCCHHGNGLPAYSNGFAVVLL